MKKKAEKIFLKISLTKMKKAKILALKKLKFYQTQTANHRKIVFLPDYLKDKIITLWNYCPLCDLFIAEKVKNSKNCFGCPLTPPSCNDYSDAALFKNIAKIKTWLGKS